MTRVSRDDRMLGQCRVSAIPEPKCDHMLQSQRPVPQSKPAFLGRDENRMPVASINTQMTSESEIYSHKSFRSKVNLQFICNLRKIQKTRIKQYYGA